MPNFHELLQVYLIPFAIAVPVGLLLIFFGTRRGGEPRIDDIEPSRQEPSHAGVPTLAAPSGANRNVDIALGDTAHFRAPAPQLMPSHGVSVSPGGGIDLPLGGADDTALASPKMTILVVDDSAVPRTKLRKLFEAHGYDVVTANDGVQALESIAKTTFAVVITDLEMPHMDGFELIAAIQGSLDTEDIPIIAITGHEEMQARVHNIQGLYGIFKKPWNDRELLKRVDVLASLKR